jgi:putative phage-type endonuclease
METVTLAQGSPEWLAHRAKHFNASDAPAMLGVSPHKTRRQLLAEVRTGITPEVDSATQRRFNNGHRLEALARPLAETMVGEPLYPVTGTNGRYSASFDGLTLGGETAFEHKALNAELRATLTTECADIPLHYRAQVEHQLLVSGATRCLFMASDFDASGALVEEHHRWIESDPVLRKRIVDGWERFAADLEHFEPAPATPAAPVGEAPETLPALRIDVEGRVIASNLIAFRETAIAAIRTVNRELTTDQHFADAELSVKWCREVETRIEAAKIHALSQTASIDELFQTLDDIAAESRRVRLDLERLVKARKDEIRARIVLDAQRALAKHMTQLAAETEPHALPPVAADFAGAIKGKRSLAAMHDAVDAALAAAKIAADAAARVVRTNAALLRERAAGRDFLFHDANQYVGRQPAEFAEWVEMRIERHRLAEESRIARERAAIEAASQRLAESAAAAATLHAPTPVPATTDGYAYTSARADHPAFAPPTAGPGAPAATPDETDQGAALSLGDINARLGITMSAAFVAHTLGITPAGKARRALLFTERQFATVCQMLIAHAEAVRMRHSEGTGTHRIGGTNGNR